MSGKIAEPEAYLEWMPEEILFTLTLESLDPPRLFMQVGEVPKAEVDVVVMKMLPMGRPAGTRYVQVEETKIMIDFGSHTRFLFISW